MIRIVFVLSALLLAGCARDPAKQAEAQQEVAYEIETILTQPLSEDEYVQGERCLSTHQYDSIEILDNRHVVFKGRGDRLWVNTLRAPCVGLRRRDVPMFELRGMQLCNLDDFVAINTSRFFGTATSATCVLGDFAPITKEQVALIKDAVAKKRN